MSKIARNYFTQVEEEDIVQVIKNAELDTSGEIRVHIETSCEGDVTKRAAVVFDKLKMHKTALRNGVLFYVALKNRKFAIRCDNGIREVVPASFKNEIRDLMLNYFREDRFVEGLIEAITLMGSQLKKYFPHKKDDVNELVDYISWEENLSLPIN
jgi:uncharacterized membrane protein